MEKLRLINLTQFQLSQSQITGFPGEVVILRGMDASYIVGLLTFDSLPLMDEVKERAETLALEARIRGSTHALIGGPPYLIPFLEKALVELGVVPIYSFTERRNSSKHVGWVGWDR